MAEVPAGIHHTHRDYYSESSPIPSIQRFFKKGLSEVIAKRKLPDSDSETEEDVDDPLFTQDSPTKPSDVAGPSTSKEQTKSSSLTQKTSFAKKRLSGVLSGSREDPDSSSDEDNLRAAHSEDAKGSLQESGNQAHRSPDQVDEAYKRSRKPRQANDPITGRSTWVHDVGKREYRRTLARADAGDREGREHVLRSQLDSNLTSQPFPPAEPLPASVLGVDGRLLPLFAIWAAVTVSGLIPSVISVALNAWLLWWGWRAVLSGAEDNRWHRERQRGQDARCSEKHEEESKDGRDQGIAEGAEWLNGILDALWSVMNPDLFSSLGGTLEDVMQASIPGFIHSVKVEDLAQGSTPIRITGLKILPDNHVGNLKEGMRKETKERRKQENRVSLPVDDKKAKAIEDQMQDEEELGEHYVNLELGVVYRARPTTNGVGGKSQNAHLLIKFWIGARKLLMLPLPVWVEIKGFVGKIRARVQLTSDPPFIKNVTITFCGLPRVGIEVVPLHINTSHIPFLSSFIESSIDAALGEFVMPSSLTFDLGEILMGDNIKREVNALGVVVVHIHSASDLEKQDLRGSSDPYCTLSLAKVGKILYSTRVVLNELSPRWEERHVILVTREHLDSQDKVSIALWDSDRFSQDDILGCAEVELTSLAKHPNKLFKRRDTLKGLDRERTKQGTISWSLGFFGKAPSIQKEINEAKGEQGQSEEQAEQGDGEHDGDDRSDEGDIEPERDGHELDKDSIDPDSPLSEGAIKREKRTQTRNQATAVDFEPPNPSLPSGILSMQIHQIANLEVDDTKRSMRPRRKDEAGQDVESVETEDDSEHAPSAYCRIILNDEIIFQTRTKALNSNPFYNAGTERSIRDWRRTLIMVVVYDFRVREADPILGIVPIKLSDIFKDSSQVTQYFPLAGGVGHGRIRLSLLFRPVQSTNRSRLRLGWNIGTVRLLSSPVATDFDGSKGASAHDVHLVGLRASTLAGKAKITGKRARYVDRNAKSAVEWRLSDSELPFKVPARRRYAAPFVIEFRALNAIGKRKTAFMSIVWLQDLPDDDIFDLRLPIFRPKSGGDFHRIRQNYHHYQNEKEAEELGVERVGWLEVKMQFKSGLGKIHTRFDNNPGAKTVMDAWRACVALGLRSVSGDFEMARENTAGYLEDKDRHEEGEPGEAYSDDDDDDDEDDSSGGLDEHPSRDKHTGDTQDGEDTDDDEEDGGSVGRSRSLKQKFTDWKAEREELHRQHKGIKQFKPVRTVSWLAETAKSTGAGLKTKFDLQDRRAQHIETEL